MLNSLHVSSPDCKNLLKGAKFNYLHAVQTEIQIVGIHGEDGGTGVITRITFITGGHAAADNFRTNTAPDWDKIQEIWPKDRFGEGCHLEGYSFTCVVSF